jgi:hypothetical protein
MNQQAFVVTDSSMRVFEAFATRKEAEGLIVDLKDAGERGILHERPMTARLYDLIVSCENEVEYCGPYTDAEQHEFGPLRSYAINTPTR